MLPDFRFVIGAVLAAAVLGVTALGLLTAARVTHQTKLGPFETSRNLVFDDSSDWNQFYDPDSARRFGELARKADATEASTQPAAEVPAQPATDVPAQTTADAPTQPVAATEVAAEPPDHDRTSDGAPPIASPVSDVVTAPAAPLPPADLAAPAMVEPAPTQTPPEKQLEEAARPEANPSSADEPRETGALTPASTAVTSPPSQDEAPNLIVTDDPPAAAAPVANAPAGAIETDAAKIDGCQRRCYQDRGCEDRPCKHRDADAADNAHRTATRRQASCRGRTPARRDTARQTPRARSHAGAESPRRRAHAAVRAATISPKSAKLAAAAKLRSSNTPRSNMRRRASRLRAVSRRTTRSVSPMARAGIRNPAGDPNGDLAATKSLIRVTAEAASWRCRSGF